MGLRIEGESILRTDSISFYDYVGPMIDELNISMENGADISIGEIRRSWRETSNSFALSNICRLQSHISFYLFMTVSES